MSRSTYAAIAPQPQQSRIQHHTSSRLPSYAERGRKEDQSMRSADMWAQRNVRAVPNKRAAATVGDTALPTSVTQQDRQVGVGESTWRVHQYQTRS